LRSWFVKVDVGALATDLFAIKRTVNILRSFKSPPKSALQINLSQSSSETPALFSIIFINCPPYIKDKR
jgi:hypothetical protein